MSAVDTDIPPLLPHEVRERRYREQEAARRRGETVDPDEIARIEARVAYSDLRWWQRLVTPKPAGWGRL